VSLHILQNRTQIDQARDQLEQAGLSCLQPNSVRPPGWLDRLLRRRTEPSVGDRVKSWDVLQTVRYLQSNLARDARVLDIGAFNCEMLPMLHRAGFTRLTGIDLNPALGAMPYADSIEYVTGNFMHTPFAAQSFDAVTAISVIEHGFDGRALLTELARVLAPGGVFVASFDYWPEKIDTSGQLFFGMSWCIFSKDEVQSFVQAAAEFGLTPVGALDFAASERAISCAGRDYTFGWMALRKG